MIAISIILKANGVYVPLDPDDPEAPRKIHVGRYASDHGINATPSAQNDTG